MAKVQMLELRGAQQVLRAEAGELVLLTGDVGSGKSLWLHRLAGLHGWPEGISKHQLPTGVRMLFDRFPSVWLGGSVKEELTFGVQAVATEQQLKILLAEWGLSELSLDCDPQMLNRHQSVCLSMAAMALAKPGLVLLDNPSAALPEAIAMDLSKTIATWAKASNTIVVVATNRWHDWHTVASQAWRVDCPDNLPNILS